MTPQQQLRAARILLQIPPGEECDDIKGALNLIEVETDNLDFLRSLRSKKTRRLLHSYRSALKRAQIAVDSLEPKQIKHSYFGNFDVSRFLHRCEFLLKLPAVSPARTAFKKQLAAWHARDLLQEYGRKVAISRQGELACTRFG